MTATDDIAEELDTCGLLCPLPVLKARKRLMALPPGALLRVTADDPAARVDFPHFCAEQGHDLVSESDQPDGVLAFVDDLAAGRGHRRRELVRAVLYDRAPLPITAVPREHPRRGRRARLRLGEADGDPAVRLVKSRSSGAAAQYEVDALSGATLTTRGVENLVHFWTGDLGFGPFLDNLKAGA